MRREHNRKSSKRATDLVRVEAPRADIGQLGGAHEKVALHVPLLVLVNPDLQGRGAAVLGEWRKGGVERRWINTHLLDTRNGVRLFAEVDEHTVA